MLAFDIRQESEYRKSLARAQAHVQSRSMIEGGEGQSGGFQGTSGDMIAWQKHR